MLNHSDIMSTVDMIDHQHLDIRTITMGISLLDCADPNPEACARKIHDKICRQAEHLVTTGCQIERELGIPIVNKRISVTPIALGMPSSRWSQVRARRRILFRLPRRWTAPQRPVAWISSEASPLLCKRAWPPATVG